MQPDARPAAPEVAPHYQGEEAREYFEYQRGGADMAALVSSQWFAPHVHPDDVVVDFGCGPGRLLARLDARERIGVEPSPFAREAAAADGVRAVPSAAELPDAHADVVISNHALEHTLSPVQELRELHRVLKPGGRLALALPIDDWRAQRQFGPDPNHHLYTWTPLLIGNLLTDCGFEVRETRVIAYALPYYNELLYRLLPRPAFDALCGLWARLRRQRQLFAVAVRP